MKSLWDELWEVIWIPVLFVAVALAVTWLVWYFGTGPETAGPVGRVDCQWQDLQNCITANLLDRMFTHGAVAGGTGGIVFYLMLTRERQLREAIEQRLEAAESREDKVRRQNDDLRQRILDLESENAKLQSNGKQEQGHGEGSPE